MSKCIELLCAKQQAKLLAKEKEIAIIQQQAKLLAKEKGLVIIEQKDVGDKFKELNVDFGKLTDIITVSYWNNGRCEWVQLLWSWNLFRSWKNVYNFLVRYNGTTQNR